MSTLTLSNDGCGPRHYVDGKDVHCGDGLQWTPDRGKTWINVRYELCGSGPVFYLPDGAQMTPSAESLFQWPGRPEVRYLHGQVPVVIKPQK